MVIDTAAMVWRRRVSNDALGGYIYVYTLYRCIYNEGREVQKEDEIRRINERRRL
jgi:hypothetical protein